MNLLLLEEDEIGPEVRISGRRARHLLEVLRARPGRRLRAGRVRGALGEATVLEIGRDWVTLSVAWSEGAPPPPSVDLVLALPRPKVLSRVLQTAACLGVRRIDLVNAWRVEKGYFDSPRLKPERVERDLRLGCEQGGHTFVPHWAVHRRLMAFVEEHLPRLPPATSLLAHPGSPAGVEAAGDADAIRLAIGPEGGWIAREVATFAQAGFTPVTLSQSVLRTEVAVAAALTGLELIRRLEERR